MQAPPPAVGEAESAEAVAQLGQNGNFRPQTVEAFCNDPDGFAERRDQPTYHYNQRLGEWGGIQTVETLLDRLNIDPQSLSITLFGGFTGEFATILRDLGCDVTFTDPLAEWVSRARADGFTAHRCTAQGLPTDLLSSSDAVGTFECYYLITSSTDNLYSVMRLLTQQHGLLFAETEQTRTAIRENDAEVTLLSPFNSFADAYGGEARYRETDGLRMYQCALGESGRDTISTDAAIIHQVEAHATEERVEVDEDYRSSVAAQLDITAERVLDGLQRVDDLCRDLLPPALRRYDVSGDFWGPEHRITFSN